MRTDPKGTKYAEELDIHHFYDSLTIETVMARLRRLVKDRRMLDVCERLMKYGVLIGAFFSQWFANTVLQPLDQMIRNSGLCDHYMRYMDNLTLFGRNKKEAKKAAGHDRGLACRPPVEAEQQVAALSDGKADGGGAGIPVRP